MLDNEGLGERKPAELGVRDREAAGFENVFPFVAVMLLACPLAANVLVQKIRECNVNGCSSGQLSTNWKIVVR